MSGVATPAGLRVSGRLAAVKEAPARLPVPNVVRVLLAVPLAGKLAGANALIALTAVVTAVGLHGVGRSEWHMLSTLILALLASIVVNIVLVVLALRPLRELQATAERVWEGDLDARVRTSAVADRDMARVGRTINVLLDRLTSDRARMRQLASKVISAQDGERSRIARELHDSTAQTLMAIVLQLSAAERDNTDPALAERLAMMRETGSTLLEEIRTLSHTLHPRVLDDLGLPAALEWLARQAREHEDVRVTVSADAVKQDLSREAASALYRVAQEALRNAVRHAQPCTVRIHLGATPKSATLEVTDDGQGFDVAIAEARRPGMGLFSMRERVALVNGRLTIDSAVGRGTTIIATVPLAP